jgi:hypothetical protein
VSDRRPARLPKPPLRAVGRRAKAGDDARLTQVPAGPQDDIAARVERECAEQDIPSKLKDPVIISRILVLMNAGRRGGVKDGAMRSTSHGSRQRRNQRRAS